MSDNKKRANNLYDAIGNLPDEMLNYKEGNEDMKVDESFLGSTSTANVKENNNGNEVKLNNNIIELETEKKKRSTLSKVLIACAACAAVVVVATVGVIVINKNHNNGNVASSASPESTADASISPTSTVVSTTTPNPNGISYSDSNVQQNSTSDDFLAIANTIRSNISGGNYSAYTNTAFIEDVVFGNDYNIDLNSDGIKEKLCIDKTEDDNNQISFITRINNEVLDIDFANDMEGCDITKSFFNIVDIDCTDSYKEIAVTFNFGNDYNQVKFYRYINNNLISLPTVEGMVPQNINAISGDGVIYTVLPSEFFTLWYLASSWKLEGESFTQETKWKYAYDDVDVVVNQDLTVYSDSSTSSSTTIIPQYSIITLVATDETEWVAIKYADALKYIHMNDQSSVDNAGKSIDAEQLLESVPDH